MAPSDGGTIFCPLNLLPNLTFLYMQLELLRLM
jgi:hypothetical protein